MLISKIIEDYLLSLFIIMKTRLIICTLFFYLVNVYIKNFFIKSEFFLKYFCDYN